MDALHYLSQLFQLLPRGRAFTRDRNSVLGKVFQAKADGAARFDARCADLLREADPRTANELIDAWETLAALPDGCGGADPDLDSRQKAIWQKVTGTGGCTADYYTEIASRLGYAVTISAFRPMLCTGPCTSTVFSASWRFVWLVTVATVDAAPTLECVLRRIKHSHTTVIFTYPGA